jgi:hypothetical protein
LKVNEIYISSLEFESYAMDLFLINRIPLHPQYLYFVK